MYAQNVQKDLYGLWVTFRQWHSDLNDQISFHSTVDAPLGVPGVSKNPDNQTKVQLTKVVFSLVFQIFWHLWGHVNSGDIIVSIFAFDIFVPQRHLAIFFILFKL